MRTTGYKFWLGLILFIFTVLLAISIYLLLTFIPKAAEDVFGQANPTLDFSQRFVYAIRLLVNQDKLINPNSTIPSIVNFQVREGETAQVISGELVHAGLIKDAEAFRTYLVYTGLDHRIIIGNYQFKSGNNALQIAQAICDLNPEKVRFVILPGMRAEEISALLPTSGLNITPQEFLRLVTNPGELDLRPELKGIPSLEGFLYPDSYLLSRNITTFEFIKELTDRFFEKITPDIINGFASNGLDLEKGVILASIVQREGVVQEERPIIASIFINRILSGMMLQSDVTIQYAIGNSQTGWWKVPLNSEDIKVSSYFNTYLHNGFPPAPICNPDVNSLMAAAFPRHTNYLYFQAQCDQSGKHVFSETFMEQLKNLCN